MKQDPDGTGRAAAHGRAAGGDVDPWNPPAVGPRVAVIGDVHGQLTALRELLVSLGADENTCELPHDLVIVQVGDLVHKGPDAPGVMDLVQQISDRQPAQWVQLVGNHEALYLTPEPQFRWPQQLPDGAADRLRDWWHGGLMRPAVAVRTATGDVLITHAGVTAFYWQEILCRPGGAEATAWALNSRVGTSSEQELFAPGLLLNGTGPDPCAGPLWAAAMPEVNLSWVSAVMAGLRALPFAQVHGHTSPYHWQTNRWWPPEPNRLKLKNATADTRIRRTIVEIGDRTITGIDPGHAYRKPWPQWEPLILEGTLLGR